MKINWCEQHSSQAHPDYKHHCWASQDDAWLGGDCRFVPMRLIPDDAETVSRLKAEWYRNGMHDIAQTTTQNGVPPLTAAEMRACVASFSTQFFAALDGETP